MPLDLNNRLHRLQRADVKTKKRYLVFGSALAMILVVLLWLFYLSLTLPRVASEETVAAVPEKTESQSFFKVISRGALNLKDDFVSQFTNFSKNLTESIQSFVGRFKETKTFTIEPGNN